MPSALVNEVLSLVFQTGCAQLKLLFQLRWVMRQSAIKLLKIPIKQGCQTHLAARGG